MGLTLLDDDGGALVIRTARKEHRCFGTATVREDGTTARRHHAPGCTEVIRPGERYLECYYTTPGFQSGHRYTEPCALEGFARRAKAVPA